MMAAELESVRIAKWAGQMTVGAVKRMSATNWLDQRSAGDDDVMVMGDESAEVANRVDNRANSRYLDVPIGSLC